MNLSACRGKVTGGTSKAALIAVSLLMICIVFVAGVELGNMGALSFVSRRAIWSISIYTGDSLANLRPADGAECPALTAEDVTDTEAEFVADPFMVKKESTWYMFFEMFNRRTGQGDISLAVSTDGLRWDYMQIVLDEPFHLSYPYVFEWQGEHYMLPETSRANAVRLYKAVDFPTRWEHVHDLVKGILVDPSLCRYNDTWWLFASSAANNELRLYYSHALGGPWKEHPRSPVIVGDASAARPGGRVLVFDGRVVRLAQDDDPGYGNSVRAFEITRLTTTDYEETEMNDGPILTASGGGWNAAGMHNADPHRNADGRWIACVDGHRWTLHPKIRW